MDENLKRRMDAALAADRAASKEAAEKEAAKAERIAAASKKYGELRATVVLPTLERFAAHLSGEPWKVQVISKSEHTSKDIVGILIDRSAGTGPGLSEVLSPSLVIEWFSHMGTGHLRTHLNNAGRYRDTEEQKLEVDQINKAFLEEKLVAFFEELTRAKNRR
ncbi:hypothetical protein [Roseomonas indoligenes]|uniref:Uncharacterized protein n=1 Tax=Roseomonas indoligenes TaxID=2820811 RepID=A0A940MY00_9PROT|nr:hypothetical protein [Pararoseomonas indoligenes]MBP0492894.1 hypothetical protein [Pararoseomonas indoligenes]